MQPRYLAFVETKVLGSKVVSCVESIKCTLQYYITPYVAFLIPSSVNTVVTGPLNRSYDFVRRSTVSMTATVQNGMFILCSSQWLLFSSLLFSGMLT